MGTVGTVGTRLMQDGCGVKKIRLWEEHRNTGGKQNTGNTGENETDGDNKFKFNSF